jgi:predicted alpha-1,2-mannosidase
MGRSTFRIRTSATTLVMLLALAGATPAVAAEPAPAGSFWSSLEVDEAQPDWLDTVEVDADGNERMSGVTGSPVTGIPGNRTGEVIEVTANAQNPPSETADRVVDGNPNTKWLAFTATGWVRVRFPEPVAIVHYALTSANDAPARDPRNWQLQGSHDGSTWTTLDTRTNQSFGARFETKEYQFENDTAYEYYRLNITAIQSGSTVQLAELQLSDGIDQPPVPTPMRSFVSGGPINGWTMRANAGWTGVRALQYSGGHTAEGRAYAYNRVFDVDIAVTPATELSYLIFPEFTANDLDYPSTYVAVDLAFSDGTYLSDLGAQDHHGFELSPQGQGASKSLYTDQWNRKASVIGEVAAGKSIERILIGYDRPAGPGLFNGWIDDIRIGERVAPERVRPSEWAITTRGSNSSSGFSRGNTFPATAVPHGFNFWTPMTNAGSTSFVYAYQRDNNADNLPTIQSFTASHAPSPWMGDRQTFQVMPSAATPTTTRTSANRALAFRHDNEVAHPHYYGVTFENGLATEIAPTDHAAMFRFTFVGDTSYVMFDNVNTSGGLTVSPAGVVTGYTDVRSGLSNGATRMYVYAELDGDITAAVKPTSGTRAAVFGHLRFDTSQDKVVTMRIATSLISVDQAKHNLELEIAPDDTFEAVRDRAQELWDDKLGIVEVEGASEDQLTTLYSNLYRLFLYPNSAHENTGTAEAPVWRHAVQSSAATSNPSGTTATQTGAPVVDGKVHVNNGFWDTYRTTWSAYALLTPSDAAEMVDGFVQHYRDGGWVPRWSSPGYANLMTGTSSDVAFADVYLKGARGMDVGDTYDAALRNATVAPPGANPNNTNVGRKGLQTSLFRAFTSTAVGEGLSWHLEGNINDYGIGNMAAAMARDEDLTDAQRQRFAEEADYFRDRARTYVNMFDPSIEFFQGRTAAGNWRWSTEAYDPRVWGYDYTETNGWNFAFHTPQDGQGLANLYGGRQGLADKLDEFFATPETGMFPGSYGGQIHEIREARDARFGMWGISNQVSHHIPFMYHYAGQPWKTQQIVREALSRSFLGSEIGQGYAGDEDNGEVSAWWLFNALGLYPLQVGSENYVIGSPLFTKATVHLEGGGELVINAPDNNSSNVYVQSLRINGEPWNRSYLPHSVIADGAVLDFDMGPQPSSWASGEAALPPSLTSGDAVANPRRDLTGPGRGTATGSAATTSDGLIPGNLVEQVVAVRASADNPPNETAARVADGDLGTKWLTFANTGWVEVDLDGPATVVHYALTSGNDFPDRDPRDWRLLGSTDGSTWTLLDERVDQSFSGRAQTREYLIHNEAAYRHYRLEVTRNNGANIVQLAELQLSDGSKPGGDTDTSALFDDTSGTRVSFLSPTPWVQYDLTGPVLDRATFYTLTSGADEGDPASWVLKGSYDGQVWTVVDQRHDELFPWRLQTRPFRIAQPGRYAHYRLEVTGSGGAPSTSLAEIELLATPRPDCTAVITNHHDGPLTVSSGVTCLDGATIVGPVRVLAGAALHAADTTIDGPLRTNGAAAVVLTRSTVTGPTEILQSTGEVSIEASVLGGPLTLTGNTGGTVVAATAIAGPMQCTANSPPPTDNGLANQVAGPMRGQCGTG